MGTKQIDPKLMLRNALALLLAIRCKSEEATRQLLINFYHAMEEDTSKQLMMRVFCLLTPKERDWLKNFIY
jgi:hypothetical protein